MIIDFHTHTYPDEIAAAVIKKLRRSAHTAPFSDGTAEGLRKNAARSGVDLSVILPVATSAHSVKHINDAAIALNEREEARFGALRDYRGAAAGKTSGDPEGLPSSRLLSFGCAHPEDGDFRKEVVRLKEAGVPGIKVHPYFHECDLDDPRYMRIFEAAAEYGLIVVTHAGYDKGYPGVHRATVPMLRRVMDEIKGITLVGAHMGGWKEWDLVMELLAGTGMYIDTADSTGLMIPDIPDEPYWENSGLTAEEAAAAGRFAFGSKQMLTEDEFAEMVRTFPPAHVLFATDSPWADPADDIGFIGRSPLTEAEKASVLGGAAAGLLGIRTD